MNIYNMNNKINIYVHNNKNNKNKKRQQHTKQNNKRIIYI